MADLTVESRAAGDAPQFRGPTADLVYFLSFAVAERYGATHELSGVARILRSRAVQPAPGNPAHAADRAAGTGGAEPARADDPLRPLLTFAEDNPSDVADSHDMEQIWQPAGPVAAAAAWTAGEIRASQRLQDLIDGFPELLPRLDELAAIAEWSTERGAFIRLLFHL